MKTEQVDRDRIVGKLLDAWAKLPHSRLCQLVANLAGDDQRVFFISDKDIERELDRLINE